MYYHIISIVVAYFMDLIIGDPYCLPHPVRLIGRFISFMEGKLYNKGSSKVLRRRGMALSIIVPLVSALVAALILIPSYLINPILGCSIETLMTYYLMAQGCLIREGFKVYKALGKDLTMAQKAVGNIVGRDTEVLDEKGVIRACVETLAEGLCDGIIAPFFYTVIGGPILGFYYKAVNTLDSMVGYKNERYLDFGRYSALTDDKFNFIPSRISASLVILSSYLAGSSFSGSGSLRVFKRDRYKHASPNSGQTESAMAGSLGLRLLGPCYYDGVLEDKEFIGDEIKSIDSKDILKASKIVFISSTIFLIISVFVLCLARSF